MTDSRTGVLEYSVSGVKRTLRRTGDPKRNQTCFARLLFKRFTAGHFVINPDILGARLTKISIQPCKKGFDNVN